MKEPAKEYTSQNRSQEHGSYIIESLKLAVFIAGINVMNKGYHKSSRRKRC